MSSPLKPGLVHRTRRVVQRRAGTLGRALHHAYRGGGPAAVARQALTMAGELLARPVRTRRERRLDHRYHLDTRTDTGVPQPTDGTGAMAAFDDAVAYSPIPVHHFRRLLRHLPIDDPGQFAFVDLGCGKGRTLILAAQHGFRPVVGVELDSRLAAVARGNAHAFGADTLRGVLDNLEHSLRRTPRRILVAYFNPVHHAVLDSSPALRRVTEDHHWTIYESLTGR